MYCAARSPRHPLGEPSPLSTLADASENPLLTENNKSPGVSIRHCVLMLLFAACFSLAALDPAALQQQLIARFGRERLVLLSDWLHAVGSANAIDDEAKLARINDFINRNIRYDSDRGIWQQNDYWATPLETIGQGAGDCEDFAIIKYVSLRMAGVVDRKLRLIYVKARVDSFGGSTQHAHMVLAYYATPNASPLILDNLDSQIQTASKRSDLHPVFSFNSEGVFAGATGKENDTIGGIGRLSRWEDAWRRIQAEGYE